MVNNNQAIWKKKYKHFILVKDREKALARKVTLEMGGQSAYMKLYIWLRIERNETML